MSQMPTTPHTDLLPTGAVARILGVSAVMVRTLDQHLKPTLVSVGDGRLRRYYDPNVVHAYAAKRVINPPRRGRLPKGDR